MREEHQRKSGGLLMKLCLLLGLSAAAIFTAFLVTSAVRSSRQCEARLQRIYYALEQYELERGTLPMLAFYPDDPREGADSLRTVLEKYGVDFETCVCPASPAALSEAGQTYIWNPALSGQRMPRNSVTNWMLVEMMALSGDVPAPHWNGYHVLYSDGKVRALKDPVKELPGL